MKEINKIELFDILKETTIRVNHIFFQIELLRKAIQDKKMIIEETKKLEQLFVEPNFKWDLFDNKLIKVMINKKSNLFNAPNINKSRMKSRGTYNFFESVYSNPSYYGDIESSLSKLKKDCESSWYGFLQAYGKIIVTI